MNVLTDTTLNDGPDELAALKPAEYPCVGLYLNTQPDQHGRDNFEPFVRKEFKARAKAFPPDSLALASFEHDTLRIREYLRDELRPSANGLAMKDQGADSERPEGKANAPAAGRVWKWSATIWSGC